MNIHEIVEAQRKYFRTGATLPVSFRKKMLLRLRDAVDRYEAEIARALAADLGKSGYESFMCEVGLVRSELSYMLRHTRSMAKEHTVWTPLAQFASRSFQKPSPYGNTLIMSPWNPSSLMVFPIITSVARSTMGIPVTLLI